MFSHSLQFDASNPQWAEIPARAGVFALFGTDAAAEPYISRTPNLRNRLRRLLDARPDQTKRLRLAASTARIEYSLTGSEFESQWLLYRASAQVFGERARKRLHLRPPVLLRMAMENAYPRVYVTNKVAKKAVDNLFGPWPSRAAAETFLEAMLNLFDLRRCVEDLNPDPEFPGCIYSEMKKCLAPCFKGCTDERYAEEAEAVYAFLATRGESRIAMPRAERETASEALDFERAAEVHARIAKVEAAASLMPQAVRALSAFNGVIVQPSGEPETVSLFLLARGALAGPVSYSVAGMRHQNEQSGSSSLFAQPVAMQPVPLSESGAPAVALAARDELETRLDAAFEVLEEMAGAKAPTSQNRDVGHPIKENLIPVPHSNKFGWATVSPAPIQAAVIRENPTSQNRDVGYPADHLSLFARWFYRPQAKRVGEICFWGRDGEPTSQNRDVGHPTLTSPAKKALLRAISRVYQNAQKVRGVQ